MIAELVIAVSMVILVILGQMINRLVKVYLYLLPLPLELVSSLILILEPVAAACPACHLML